MSFDDDLQRSFDVAGSAVDLDPGSIDAVKRRAARRNRNARLAAGSVAVLAFLAVTQVGGFIESSPVEVATDVAVEPDVETDVDDAPVEDAANAEAAAATTTTDDEAERPGAVTEDDFEYLGAFLLPAGDIGNSSFAFGGDVSAFNPFGDPDGTDDFAGSLFMSGHPRRNQGVAEVTIPEPALHSGATEGLPVADLLQPFADITGGRAAELVGSVAVGGQDEFRYGGLEVLDGPEGTRLHWSVRQYGNVAENLVPGHGHSSLDLSTPDPQGPWFLGQRTNRQTAGYVLTAPSDFADKYLGGRRLLVGNKAEPNGADLSWGPPLFAYQPPSVDEAGAVVDVIDLILYPEDQPLADYRPADVAPGAAWVSTSDGTEAVVTVGRRGLGEIRYGVPQEGDCSEYAGVHADPYQPQIMFYDPADLAGAAEGRLALHTVEPYRRWNPSAHLIPNCDWFLSSISFDPQSNRAFIVQTGADLSQRERSPAPVVHVFQL